MAFLTYLNNLLINRINYYYKSFIYLTPFKSQLSFANGAVLSLYCKVTEIILLSH